MNEDNQAREKFLITLDWLLALNERYENAVRYGLLHVCFHGKQQLGNAYGAQHAATMLINLAAKLRKAFRTTDLVARDGTDFWILIPYTDPKTVIEKVSQLVEISSESGLDIVDRDLAFFNTENISANKPAVSVGAQAYLEHLRKNRTVSHRWEPHRVG